MATGSGPRECPRAEAKNPWLFGEPVHPGLARRLGSWKLNECGTTPEGDCVPSGVVSRLALSGERKTCSAGLRSGATPHGRKLKALNNADGGFVNKTERIRVQRVQLKSGASYPRPTTYRFYCKI